MIPIILLHAILLWQQGQQFTVTLEYFCDKAVDQPCDPGPRRFGFNSDGTPYLINGSSMDFHSEREALDFLEANQGYGGMYLIEDVEDPGNDWPWKKVDLCFTIDATRTKHYTTDCTCHDPNGCVLSGNQP
jgi:hypothetical protein